MDELFDGSNAHPLAACPKCGRKWMPPCEQTICIDAHGECIPCRFVPVGGEINKHGSGAGTTEELDAISAAAKVGASDTATDGHNAIYRDKTCSITSPNQPQNQHLPHASRA